MAFIQETIAFRVRVGVVSHHRDQSINGDVNAVRANAWDSTIRLTFTHVPLLLGICIRRVTCRGDESSAGQFEKQYCIWQRTSFVVEALGRDCQTHHHVESLIKEILLSWREMVYFCPYPYVLSRLVKYHHIQV